MQHFMILIEAGLRVNKTGPDVIKWDDLCVIVNDYDA